MTRIDYIHIIIELQLSLSRYQRQLTTDVNDIHNEWIESRMNVVKELITTLEKAELTA